MTITTKSRALVAEIERVSRLPLLSRAQQAERVISQAAALLVELADQVQEHAEAVSALRAELDEIKKRGAARA